MKTTRLFFLFGCQLFLQMHEAFNSPTVTNPRLNSVVQKDNVRRTGTMKFFNMDKGYGFIAPDDGGQDLFCHMTKINASYHEIFNTITDGTRVSFFTRSIGGVKRAIARRVSLL